MTLTPVDPFAYAADLLDPPEHPYANDISGWTGDVLEEHMTRDQIAITRSVEANRYTAVQSCHDVGKSYTASRIATHWIETHPPGEAFVVTTAPTWRQVRAVLWREIGKAHRKGGLRGRITEAAEWKLDMGLGPAELVAMGLKPADYDPTGFQGIHARYVLVIIDEATGVPKAIWDAADSLVTNEDCRMLAIGNPDDPASHFATVCKPGSGWKVMRIDALMSPNFTKERVAQFPALRALMIREGIAPTKEQIPDRLRPYLISPEWVAERITRWGVDSPLWKSKVRGEFPDVTLDTLIAPGWVLAAQNRELEPTITEPRFGVDVARYGTDRSVVALRQGGHVRIVYEEASGPVTGLAGKVAHLAWDYGPSVPPVNVDDTGVGGGVTDILIEEGLPVLPLISGGTSTETLPNGKPRFVNARSEWWWTLREALAGPSGDGSDGWLDLDPDDDELAAQILAVKYSINRHGQIVVESKDEMRKRGLASPDRADAVVYSLVIAEPVHHPLVEHMLTSDLLRGDAW